MNLFDDDELAETFHDQIGGTIRGLAREGKDFSANEVVAIVGHPDDEHAANARNNIIGSAFAEAHKQGWIYPVGVVKSTQPHRKGGMIRVWRGTGRA